MPFEIERKFLVAGDGWRVDADSGSIIRQAYLANTGKMSLRIRTRDSRATLTMKSAGMGISRLEFEYDIPLDHATALMELREGSIIEKRRHLLPWYGLTWEIDVFQGENDGLVVAEIELPHEDHGFPLPSWIGAEISGDPRYSNASLCKRPFSRWGEAPAGERVADPEM
ncbi:adenylate cyclase [Rhodomicrobium vannielii ATCC 17100]|uniref:Adenylate cyclase n=1 Tax=Rhodomicrobium vannielii (strain ATCC 17100 / DSM 162 / LMG 4299 / NCIMB 10020 / ATH 3.1.1) TaxID=648757 RepID=E3I0C7_RHOVT|nr:CYTH domain-containing protein [Rhodomicrobium vannielii]ADP72245.1 adenylate cyclase [Rhodomicrobium vannielii ATCC 17100]